MIQLIKDNVEIARLLWAIQGVAAYFILRKTRPEHYENRKPFWWVAYILFSFLLGPLYLLIGVITLLVRKRKVIKTCLK
jgi:tryptophan-rich sensory protein